MTSVKVDLSDRDAAKEWIITNQLARRNLSLYQRGRLVLQRDEIFKARAREKQQEHCGTAPGISKSLLHQVGEVILKESDSAKPQDEWTDHKLAKIAGTSHTTIARIRTLENETSIGPA